MLTNAALIFLIWLLSGTAFGFATMFFGPGVVLLFAGILMGFSGGLLHALTRLADVKMQWWYAGICVAIVSVLVTAIIMRGDTLKPVVAAFLFILYVIPSTVIFALTDRIKKGQ